MTAPIKPLPPDVAARVKAVLDRAARRLLDEELEREAKAEVEKVRS
jgi:hypothetical protein